MGKDELSALWLLCESVLSGIGFESGYLTERLPPQGARDLLTKGGVQVSIQGTAPFDAILSGRSIPLKVAAGDPGTDRRFPYVREEIRTGTGQF